MGFLDRFKSDREKELKEKSLVKGADIKKDAPKVSASKSKTTSIETKAKDKTESKKVDTKVKKEAVKKIKTIPESLGYIISHPLVTEKSAVLASQGTYVFVVSTRANKIQVRNAIKALYGIIPVSVNIQNVRGKAVRFGRHKGQRNSWKKALVTLPKGKSIDVYESA